RMDLNPQWVIPRSIVEKSIVKHAGDSAYFAQHRYFVRERKSGKRVAPHRVTASMLASSNYFVIQEGGEGNSLGRIIFRFDNNFSVFIHYTSAPDVFERSSRDVSHGCIRVERPLDLAVFLLKEKEEELIDRIGYSMTVDLETDDEDIKKEKSEKLLHSLKVEPQIPLFITYYTIYPDLQGHLQQYSDVYGYDGVIYKELRNYTE
ncbi:MAG TPA: L,D-transpeptidase family protein, partial [Prevotella sp.]